MDLFIPNNVSSLSDYVYLEVKLSFQQDWSFKVMINIIKLFYGCTDLILLLKLWL